jgi:hypothetical protein
VAPPAPAGRFAFVSAIKWQPGGGLASADAVCASEASMAGLAGTYKAALATSTGGALARFSSIGARWVRPDGVAITATTAAMFDPNLKYLDAPINVTAAGAYVVEPAISEQEMAWSGPRTTPGTNTCVDWTDASSAHTGSTSSNAWTWLLTVFVDGAGSSCNQSRRLYCLQQ